MHFLITGHTGFKGTWLTLMLNELGHKVSGIALRPEANSIFQKINGESFLVDNFYCDVRDRKELEKLVNSINPDVVVHLAAQALVRRSYTLPLYTYEVNVNGTLNLLNATKLSSTIQAQIIVTTDKVYMNTGKLSGYIESDPLGGRDPYSASKSMADIATQSWAESCTTIPTAIARAGNVIGGGDISEDRLMPDLINSFKTGKPIILRSPDSIRPWQHVLDCLNGYVLLANSLINGKGVGCWNFGPTDSTSKTVADVVDFASEKWGANFKWYLESREQPHEEVSLVLNCDKAVQDLGWTNKLDFEESIAWTINWYKELSIGMNAKKISVESVQDFLKLS